MNFNVMVTSVQVIGCNRTASLAGEFIESGLSDYGPAIREMWVTLAFRGGDSLGLETLYERFHSEHLPALPKIRFYRTKQKVELEYETNLADATFLLPFGNPSVEMFPRFLEELVEKLHLIDRALKKSDAFDLARFHADAAAQIKLAPRSLDELLELEKKLDILREEKLALLGPWEKLDIDWDDYHPSARALLNDPLLWDSANDFGPHGNDTGADLLADFKKWNRRHPEVPAHRMAEQLLRAWDIPIIDVDLTEPGVVRERFKADWISLLTTNEAMIAAAFAAVKFRGCCDVRTRQLALNAIAREHACIEERGWTSAADRAATLNLLTDMLQRAPVVAKE